MTPWIYTRELQQRAEQEGWGIFDSSARGPEVERIDSPDNGNDPLPNDDAAIVLALAAGVPCSPIDGTIQGEWEYES